ncbi:MAG: glutaminase A [Pseudomonadota bacterium]|nr:glutaminase A [Pseudomonadota bacterium]
MQAPTRQELLTVMERAVAIARENDEGAVANYIPELAQAPADTTSIAVTLLDGTCLTAGDAIDTPTTLQSTSKLVVLIGLLEEVGIDEVTQWTKFEPSGSDFASVARLDQFGPRPSNPMLNSGAISLCSHIPGNAEQKLAWLDDWMMRLFGTTLNLNHKVYASERRTGDRNRCLAYLLKSRDMLADNVDEVLDTYFALCSFEANIVQASYLPLLLANGGKNPMGEQIISIDTVRCVLSVMVTCGLYNESGTHMVRTGLPAKSGVSGYILAAALNQAGIAVLSPRVNAKGTSVRGEIMLEQVSKAMGWHFAG